MSNFHNITLIGTFTICILSILTGCSRSNLETLNTTIHTVDVVPNWDKMVAEEVTVFCDISVTVNNVDGSIGVRYTNFRGSFSVSHALVERSEEVIEQNFPHLGDVELEGGDPLSSQNETAKERCVRQREKIEAEISVKKEQIAKTHREIEAQWARDRKENEQDRLAERELEQAAEKGRDTLEKQKKVESLMKEQRERRQRVLDEAQRLRRERDEAVKRLKETPR